MQKSLHINLSEEKLKELKSHCALNGITMKDLLLELIAEYLNKIEDQNKESRERELKFWKKVLQDTEEEYEGWEEDQLRAKRKIEELEK